MTFFIFFLLCLYVVLYVPRATHAAVGSIQCQVRDDLNAYFDLLRINQSSSQSLKWMGGDISTSIPLATIIDDQHADRSITPYLWLFGDTLVGHLTAEDSHSTQIVKKCQFTSNTVAIQNLISTSTFTVMSHASDSLVTSFDEPQFYIPLNQDGSLHSQGIFTPPTNTSNICPSPRCKYWCISGIHLTATTEHQASNEYDTLVLFCQTPTRTDLASQYTTVLYVNNITSSVVSSELNSLPLSVNPLSWSYQSTYMPSPYSGHDYGWGTSVTKNHEDGLIYLVGQNNSHTNLFQIGIYLARISENSLLTGNWSDMEVFCSDGEWSPLSLCIATHGLNNLIGFPSSYTETSLVYSDILQQWLLLLLDTNGNTVYLATTPTLSQPLFPTWKVMPIYDIPAPFNNKSAGLFNYAAKIHPQFSVLSAAPHNQAENNLSTAKLVFSFNTNGPLNDLNTDLDIYHPHFVECQLDV